jgi:ribosomal subunit interface protein
LFFRKVKIMEIVVAGRHTEVPERFREFAESKLRKIEQYDSRAHLVQVEVIHESSPRQADTSETVEITVRGKGPVIRAEASAADVFSAFDVAMGKLMQQERRAHDRRKSKHRTSRREAMAWDASLLSSNPPAAPDTAPAPAAPLTATIVSDDAPSEAADPADAPTAQDSQSRVRADGVVETVLADSPVVIREKVHEAEPMSVEDAIYEMELVGHPFFLFVDKSSQMPSVLYHRHGWTYGVLRLQTRGATTE